MYGIWTHPETGDRYAVEIQNDRLIRAYGPLADAEGRTWASIRYALDGWGDRITAEWIEDEMARTVVRSYRHIAQEIVICNDCGAYAPTEEAVRHEPTCNPGESEDWRKFFEELEP